MPKISKYQHLIDKSPLAVAIRKFRADHNISREKFAIVFDLPLELVRAYENGGNCEFEEWLMQQMNMYSAALEIEENEFNLKGVPIT
jgi:hypothetical protein